MIQNAVLRRALGHPLPILLTVLVVGALVIVVKHDERHELRAVFSNAISLSPGLDVQVDGVKIGRVDSVKLDDGQAVVKLGIKDHWPLPQGTTAVIRYGTTLGLGTRYVQLIPGPKSAAELADGGVIPQKQAISAVELDEIFNMYDRGTRSDVRRLVGGIDTAASARREKLSPTVHSTADSLAATSGLLRDLGHDQRQLTAFVDQADAATSSLAAKQPVIEDLLNVAATTFTQFGSRNRAIRVSLDELAPALRETTGTLAHVDRSLGIVDSLFTDLRPALSALRPFITEARPALAGLRELAPETAATLAVARTSAPAITRLAKQVQQTSEPMRSALAGLAPQMACVRPYGPEIAGFLTTWASWGQDYDNTSHYARVKANQGPTSNDSTPPISTDSFLSTAAGGLKYAMPRPPGLNAGKPWFLPGCGAGPNAVDASKDPEDG